jgi:hypothetical protein
LQWRKSCEEKSNKHERAASIRRERKCERGIASEGERASDKNRDRDDEAAPVSGI